MVHVIVRWITETPTKRPSTHQRSVRIIVSLIVATHRKKKKQEKKKKKNEQEKKKKKKKKKNQHQDPAPTGVMRYPCPCQSGVMVLAVL